MPFRTVSRDGCEMPNESVDYCRLNRDDYVRRLADVCNMYDIDVQSPGREKQ